MSQSTKQTKDFSDISYHDVVAMLMNTAVVAKNSGHTAISARNGRVSGQPAIILVMPGYRFEDGRLQRAEPVVANGVGDDAT